jgi:predicted Zn-dependent protease
MNILFAKRLLLGLCCLFLLADCAQNPVTGQQMLAMMSEADEVQAGKRADPEVRSQYGVYDDPALQAYVNEIGQRLAQKSHRPGLAYHFTVVDSPEINAFALPGGYVYITRGILAYLGSEAELAAVLGHEIGHVTARHSVQQYSAAMAANIGLALGSLIVPELRSRGAQDLLNVLGNAILSGYSREHELEADRLGAEYLARAGYSPQAMVRVIGVLKNQELFDLAIARQEGREPRAYHGVFATHPDADTRLREVVGEADKYLQTPREDGRAVYLARIDGLLFGDNPRQGTVRGRTFLHEDLGFAVDFPPEWHIRNRPDRVTARSPENDAVLQLQLADGARGSPAELLRRSVRFDRGAAFETAEINGLPAAIATGRSQGRPVRAAAIRLQQKVFILAGAAKTPAAFDRHLGAINDAIGTFRRLSEAERKRAKPLVVRTITAATDTSFSGLARRSPLGRNAESHLRLMNHAYPEGEPKPGETVKIVE